MLKPYIVHPKEECRQEGEDHDAHRALAVDGIVHMCTTALRRSIRNEEERL